MVIAHLLWKSFDATGSSVNSVMQLLAKELWNLPLLKFDSQHDRKYVVGASVDLGI